MYYVYLSRIKGDIAAALGAVIYNSKYYLKVET